MKRRITLKSERLASELEQSRLTQNAWALRLGISKAYLSQLLSGQRRHPGPAMRDRLLRATGLRFDELFERSRVFESEGREPIVPPLLEWRARRYRFRIDRIPPENRFQGDSMRCNLWPDLRQTFRGLVRTPAFSLIAVGILAVGIGANTTMFSVVNQVLLEPLPFPEPDRIVHLWQASRDGSGRGSVSPANYLDWKTQARSFAAMSAYATGSAVLSGDGEPESVDVTSASPDFFKALQVEPLLGSFYSISPEETGEPVVVLSAGLWQRRFGGDRSVVGRSVVVDGVANTVIGVMPQRSTFPPSAQLWRPLVFDFDIPQSRGAQYLAVLARLGESVSEEEAQTELDVIAARLEAEHAKNRGTGIRAVSLQRDLTRNSRTSLLVLQGAVGLILLIACANVANLLMARATTRRRELAVRRALGAGRGRLAQHLLAESLLIAAAGGVGGLGLSELLLPGLLAILPASHHAREVSIDGTVFIFAMAIALATSLVCALAPMLRWSGKDPQQDLAAGRHTASNASQSRLRSGLIVAEVALSVTLVVGAVLLLQTFWNLLSVDPGFDPSKTVAIRVGLPAVRYEEPEARRFFDRLLAGVASIPDVEASGAVAFLPLGGSWMFSFDIEDREPFRPGEKPSGAFRPFAGNYFRTLGIPLLRGRLPGAADSEESAPVVVINETLARRFFPDGDELGKKLLIGYGSGEIVPREIVGVVSDIKQWGLGAPSPPGFYLPHSQLPFRGMWVVARAARQDDIVPLLKQQVWALDDELAVAEIQTLEERLSGTMAPQRARMWLVGSFAALALMLALFGIYGLISYSVHQRLGEVGVRLAMGAAGGDIVRLFVKSGVTLAAAGIAIGLAASAALTRILESMLFETSATDPATFGCVGAIVAVTAWIACYLPARRALRVDPATILRAD